MVNKQTIVPTWIALLVIFGFLFCLFALVVLGNSQWANLRRVERWIEAQQPEWEALTKEHPELKPVTLTGFTGGGGTLGVNGAGVDLSAEDETALYRYLLESQPPRPVQLMGIKSGDDETDGIADKIAKIEYAAADDFVSMAVLEESNLHKKEFRRTWDGKIVYTYSVSVIDLATGKFYWVDSIYWTWEKDLPEEFIRQMKIDN